MAKRNKNNLRIRRKYLVWRQEVRGISPPASLPQPEAFPDWLACDLAHERAAIMEYDAGLPRAKAEALATKAHLP